jgi:tetratricopeptide (TPR) repeat protein
MFRSVMKQSIIRRAICSTAAILALSAPAAAHDGPEHEIEHLTARIKRRGPTAPLLYQRASEYRVLGKLDKAAADLLEALKMDPRYLDARVELARVQLADNKPTEALTAINQALDLVTKPDEWAALLIVRSDIELARGETAKALADCESACHVRSTEVDWLLKRSQLQAELKLPERRVTDLAAACRLVPSAVLKIEWVEALLDARQMQPALEKIEAELEASRWQSAWLVRRARALEGLGRHEDAQADLRTAIDEINGRYNPVRPDLTLLVDRGLAYALCGERAAAAKDLATAKAHKAEPWLLTRLEGLLNSSESAAR